MSSEEVGIVAQRKAGLEEWYKALIPALVEFVGNLGISPAHGVQNARTMLDPFEVAKTYVDTPVPRRLQLLLDDVDVELLATRND